MPKKHAFIFVVTGLLLFAGGIAVGARNAGPSSRATGSADANKYPLLAKRIFMDEPNDTVINFSPLRQDLRAYFKDHNLSGGLYFEYLPTGTSVRVDGDEEYVAASLLKVPAAMDLYRAHELGKIDIDKKITLQQAWLDSGYGTLYQKGAGHSLSLREAAKIMLQDSDNTALKAIASSMLNALKTEEYAFNSLDVDITQNADLSVSISPKSYSSFLKCLYFSCYVNTEHSQEILQHLTSAKNADRLPAGVKDKSIKVAHKIGVFSEDTQSDCGIVYAPKRNYILCIMIKGTTSKSIDAHIAKMSQMAYEYVVRQ